MNVKTSPPPESRNGLNTKVSLFGYEALESAYEYKPGFFHPVHLGDCFGDQGQYRVIHKVSVNIDTMNWLCLVRDSNPTRYVVLKIAAEYAEDTDLQQELEMISRLQDIAKEDELVAKYCNLPIDTFKTADGPNGTHQCYVYPAAGPSFREMRKTVNGDPAQFLRDVARQTTEALAALHRHGICYDDIRPSKVLLQDPGLDGMSEKEALDYLGVPEQLPIGLAEGYPSSGAHFPNYLVAQVEYWQHNTRFASQNICLSNFRHCFPMSNPPKESRCTPNLSPPEGLLGEKPSAASDVWTLGCLIFQTRTGNSWTFAPWYGVEATDEYLAWIVRRLGAPFPEPWWSTTWKGRRRYYKDHPDANGNAISARGEPVREHDRLSNLVVWWGEHTLTRADGKPWDTAICSEESELLVDLLMMIFKYDPKERPTMEQVLEHPWFSYRTEEHEPGEESSVAAH